MTTPTRPDIRTISIDQIKRAAYNPRIDLQPGDAEYEAIARSLDEFGMVEPLIWNERTGNLVGGHQRLKILIGRGDTDAIVSVVDLDDERERALNVALNRVQGRWDPAALGELLRALPAGLIDVTGYQRGQVDELLRDLQREADKAARAAAPAAIDDAPDQPKTATTKPGELWILGRHRLICADATDTKAIKKLMKGDAARLMATDPPYGIAYTDANRVLADRKRRAKIDKEGGNTRDKSLHQRQEIWTDPIAGDAFDSVTEPERVRELLAGVFTAAAAVFALEASAAWYVWHDLRAPEPVRQAIADAGGIIHRQIVWVKGAFNFGLGDYHLQHETAFYGWRQGNRPTFYGERNQSTTWQIAHDTNKRVHPTQKPVALFQRPIENHTLAGDVVFEPFGGSGSQLIAAETLDRRCYLVELDATWCDVIIERWQQHSGGKARRSR